MYKNNDFIFILGMLLKLFFYCLYSFSIVQERTIYWANQRSAPISDSKNHDNKSSYYFLLIYYLEGYNSNCACP